jgi:hypothetical protein
MSYQKKFLVKEQMHIVSINVEKENLRLQRAQNTVFIIVVIRKKEILRDFLGFNCVWKIKSLNLRDLSVL